MLGVDKQPLRVPLHMTEADLEDMLGPATYRLDLCDQNGSALGVTIPITIGEETAPDEANEAEGALVSAPTAPLPSTTSEVRLLLEANLRAMNASFQHNERTLTASLRMADTLRDGVRVLAEAQSEWIKSLASAKGYLRNAAVAAPAPLPPPSPESPERDDDGDEDEAYGYEPAAPKSWADVLVEALAPTLATVAPMLIEKMFASKPGATNRSATSGVRDFVRGVVDWKYAAQQGAAKQAEADGDASAADAKRSDSSSTLSPTEKLDAALEQIPPLLRAQVKTKFEAVHAKLSADEAHRAFELVERSSDRDRIAFVSQIMTRPVEETVVLIRQLIDDPELRQPPAAPAEPEG